MTTDGRPYFQNTVTRQTSWNKPASWAEPGTAAASTETTAAARGVDGGGAAEARTPGGGVAGEFCMFGWGGGGVGDAFSRCVGARRVACARVVAVMVLFGWIACILEMFLRVRVDCWGSLFRRWNH